MNGSEKKNRIKIHLIGNCIRIYKFIDLTGSVRALLWFEKYVRDS